MVAASEKATEKTSVATMNTVAAVKNAAMVYVNLDAKTKHQPLLARLTMLANKNKIIANETINAVAMMDTVNHAVAMKRTHAKKLANVVIETPANVYQ
tara:strand:- start:814 stop:1107 length:294 start_codon:yes stop_codon:yes gene_type:complete